MMDSRFSAKGALAIAGLLAAGCGSHPRMRVGASVQVERGYVIDRTRFSQRGKEVDRSHVKEVLEKQEESAVDMRRGGAFETAAQLTQVPAFILLGWGITGVAGASELDDSTALGMVVGGAVCLGMSVTFWIAAENNYVNAVNAYNAAVAPSPGP
jgi:hypothetical protein